MTEKEILEKLRDVDCQLSPENLSCDGELSMKQQRVRYNQLQQEAKSLLKQLGRVPTYGELYPEYCPEHMKNDKTLFEFET